MKLPVVRSSLKVLLLGCALVLPWLANTSEAASLDTILAATRALSPGHEEPAPLPNAEPGTLRHTHCEDGFANIYPCRKIDLLSFMPRSEIGGSPTIGLNDIWGWRDPVGGKEYALVGLTDGLSFVDISDPEDPKYMGKMPTRTIDTAWRDVKTYQNHAYVVADNAGGHGLQVFDLRRLRSAGSTPQVFAPDREYFGSGLGVSQGIQLGSAHNLAINEETGFLYIVGSNTCGGGLHMVDLNNPRRPRFAGCYAEDGYTHDAQCVVYRGPDTRFAGQEICFNSNEDTLTLVDVTDKSNPRQLSRTTYNELGYAHQAWVTEDHTYLISNDELDEIRRGHGTRTLIWDISDLTNPVLSGTYEADSRATDHNLYVRGNLVFEANYSSGLRIFDMDRIAEGRLREVAYFDTLPDRDEPGFIGAWSVYPFFRSGVVVVSSIGQGLFVLQPFPPEHDEEGTQELAPPRRLKVKFRDERLVLSWRDSDEGETPFRVYKELDEGGMALVREVEAGRHHFIDREIGLPATYTYYVTTVDGERESRPVAATFIVDRLEGPGEAEEGGGHGGGGGGRRPGGGRPPRDRE